jgi:hypothetical protein
MILRRNITRILLSISLSIFLFPSFSKISLAGTNYYNEGAVYLEVGNTDYMQLDFMKLYGNLETITNNQNSQELSPGTTFDLWSAKFYQSNPVASYAGSTFLIDPELAFQYSWNAGSSTLTMTFDGSGKANSINATIDVKIYDAPYVDIIYTVENNSGGIINELVLANAMGISFANLEEILLPESPGIIIDKEYFNSGPASYSHEHPGGFANFYAISQTVGNLAMYTLSTEANFTPSWSQLSSFGGPSDLTLNNTFDTWIEDGDTWVAPTLRLRMYDNFFDLTKSYKADSELPQYPSLETKLGSRKQQIIESPLFHMDPIMTSNFDGWPAIFNDLPKPSIFMLADLWEGGFHGYHPDYIPPDAAYGTVQELSTAIDAAHDNNQLIMPFTLPSWWHEDSDTVTNQLGGLTTDDISMIDAAGTADYASWTLGAQVDWGYFVSPYNSFVKTRVDNVLNELVNDFDMDLIYEDVVGARRCYYDFNPANLNIMDCNGWFDHVEDHKDKGIVIETGYDLFVKNSIGFMGSDHVAWAYLDDDFGAGNWRVFPFVPSLIHDKVLSYQYWADYTATKEGIGWNMAMGFMLNYNLIIEGACAGGCPEPMGSDWEDVVGDFQKNVVSRYATREMTGFSDIDVNNLTVSTFDDIVVTRNWSEGSSFEVVDEWAIPTLGFAVESNSGDLTAGVFTAYNGVDFGEDQNYLIEQRTDTSVTLWMPLGVDSDLTLDLPSGWDIEDEYTFASYDVDEMKISDAAYTVESDAFTYSHVQSVDSNEVAYYELAIVVVEPPVEPPIIPVIIEPTGETEDEETVFIVGRILEEIIEQLEEQGVSEEIIEDVIEELMTRTPISDYVVEDVKKIDPISPVVFIFSGGVAIVLVASRWELLLGLFKG